MAIKIGLDGLLQIGTAGSTATTEVENTRDVSFNVEAGEADITTRGSVWEAIKATLLSGTVEFEILWDSAEATCTTIRTNALARTATAFCIRDSSGGHGLDADFYITRFGRNEQLREGMMVPVTLKVTTENRNPAWVTS